MQPVIRDAHPSDARWFEEIRVAGWKTAYVGLMDADFLASYAVDEARVQMREKWLADLPAGHVMLVAEQSGEIIGGTILTPSRDDDLPDAAELLALYVDPVRRSGGVGGSLMAAGFARMSQEVQSRWVLEGNVAARAFYERHGFRVDGASKARTDIPGEPVEVRYRRPRLG
jgi:predicted N-acetyltransferase YhbS